MEPALVQLLQQQLSPAGPSGATDLPLDRITELLTQREAELTRNLQEQELEESRQRDDELRTQQRRDQAEALRRYVDDIVDELTVLRGTVDTLAGALGACPQCWGEDGACRWCRGRGRPGFLPPDPASFAELVMPAVRVHALQRRRHDTVDDGRHTEEGNA